MGKLRPDSRTGIGSADGVAHYASSSGEDLLAPLGECIGWLGCRLHLLLQPRLKFFRRFGDDEEGHVRVLMSAELGALSAKAAFLVCLDPDCGVVTRQEIALAVNVRRPEAVDHVS